MSRRCQCGTKLNSYNPTNTCASCKQKVYDGLEVDDRWLPLIENATDSSIELIAAVIAGRKVKD